MKNSSRELILNNPIFQKLIQALGPVDVDLFASRLCHQILKYISWFQIHISNKLDTPKSIRLPTFCSDRESVSESSKGQVYFDHNNTNVASATMVHPVIENVYITFNFHSPISKSFDSPKLKPAPIVSELNISSMEGLRQQYSAEGLSDQTIDLLESS